MVKMKIICTKFLFVACMVTCINAPGYYKIKVQNETKRPLVITTATNIKGLDYEMKNTININANANTTEEGMVSTHASVKITSIKNEVKPCLMQDEQLPLYTDVHTDSSQVRGVLVSVKPIKNDKWGCKVSIKREEE